MARFAEYLTRKCKSYFPKNVLDFQVNSIIMGKSLGFEFIATLSDIAAILVCKAR